MNEGDVTIDPQWLAAAEEVAENCAYGDLLTKEWLTEAFGLQQPEFGTVEDFERHKLEFMQCMDQFSRQLLEEHNLALQNVWGQGYRIVPPSEQVDVAWKAAMQGVRRELRKLGSQLRHIRYDELELSEQKKRDDASSRLSQINGFMRRASNRRVSADRMFQVGKRRDD